MGKEKDAPRDDRFTEEMQLEFEEDGEESPEEDKVDKVKKNITSTISKSGLM